MVKLGECGRWGWDEQVRVRDGWAGEDEQVGEQAASRTGLGRIWCPRDWGWGGSPTSYGTLTELKTLNLYVTQFQTGLLVNSSIFHLSVYRNFFFSISG